MSPGPWEGGAPSPSLEVFSWSLAQGLGWKSRRPPMWGKGTVVFAYPIFLPQILREPWTGEMDDQKKRSTWLPVDAGGEY